MAATHPLSRRPFAEFGARIKADRSSLGLSQENFAPVIAITRRHLIRLENGEHCASPDVRERIAKATGEKADRYAPDEDEEESLPDALRALVRALRAELAEKA